MSFKASGFVTIKENTLSDIYSIMYVLITTCIFFLYTVLHFLNLRFKRFYHIFLYTDTGKGIDYV
mgnify:CR=1 FL=1